MGLRPLEYRKWMGNARIGGWEVLEFWMDVLRVLLRIELMIT